MNSLKDYMHIPNIKSLFPLLRSIKVFRAYSLLLVFASCYSVEFIPSADYAGLRYRPGPASIEIVYERPEGPHRRLGLVSIRDVDDPRSLDFREFVVEEARRRGAPAAWIRADQMRSVPHGTFGGWFNPGDGIGIVPVVLFSRLDP